MSDSKSMLQLVTFKLGREIYGIDIMDVKEIVKIQDIRSIPGAPEYVVGILNLRGSIIPVIDLHKRFNFQKQDLNEDEKLLSGIVIINIDAMLVGIIIDKVEKVENVETEEIQPPPQLFSGIGSEFIQGVVKRNDRYMIILDARRLFSKSELKQLDTISK